MASASEISAQRIEGWKSIGAFFGRDRTTAIRWARDRNLPVHRIPGGKTSTTFALRHELEAWVRSSTASAKLDAVSERPALALVAVPDRPVDPAIQEDYLRARDWIMGRNARAIEQAVSLLRDITQRAPDYAAAYVALAEALVLSREFGERSDLLAFPPAQFALRTGLRLNPALASGHRVAGFIAYWWDRDMSAARQSFRHALDLAPADPITHFWLGNILADHGEFADGISHLNQARSIQPGSVPILTDLAWAQWSAGDQARPLAALQDIAQDHPRYTVAHEYLAYIALIAGDYAGHAAELALLGRLRMNDTLSARAADIALSLTAGRDAAHRCILRHALNDLAHEPGRTSAWAVLVAAVGGVPGQAVELLERAVRRREQWGEAGFVRGIRMNASGLDPWLDRLTCR
ncbi:hypothetical protein GRI97_09895 [Altererythrobacter xixiisoli]|uniref:Uncharacterized protein n=1 Tax=Croceibacterium xixiisoli TaxID=1476466 RepID=A0A6I4TVM8_9SPHN|nr:hypothetical protein [Croceibacterium xixiisoli]MXO99300.1 hypothetical protein [Croceibacterium xixiisoli]